LTFVPSQRTNTARRSGSATSCRAISSPAANEPSPSATLAIADRSEARSKRTMASDRLSSCTAAPWISPAVEQPMWCEVG
jgi:hypothetical protein